VSLRDAGAIQAARRYDFGSVIKFGQAGQAGRLPRPRLGARGAGVYVDNRGQRSARATPAARRPDP
jgi:hypothetical protein